MVELISVLYVDDEASLLLVGKIFLEESGDFFVTTVESAQEGLSFLEKEHVDAIVADYMMPFMDGIAFLKRVRKQFGDIPFILFTGRGREEVVIEAINNGADFYLQKGGDPQAQFAELAHKIRQAVRRKEAEKLFCESEKRLSDIINFLPDATFAIDKSGKVIAWNRAIEEMTGVSSVEILGKGDHEYAIPFYGSRRSLCIDLILEPDEKKSSNYSTISHEGYTITAEVDIDPPKGSFRRTLIKACPLYDEAGEIIGAIESIRDITDLKTAQQELMDSEKKFRNVVTYSRDCILIVGFDGIIQFINQTGLSMIDEEDFDSVIGRKNIMDYIHPDSVRTITSDMHTIGQGMDGYLSQYKLITAKKRELWVESLGRKIPYQDSEMILASLRDITEQKLADIELREREERYRSIARMLPMMVFEVDPDMNLTYLNEFGRALMGITSQDISNRISALSCIHPSFHEIIRDNFQMLLNGIPYEPEIYLAMRKDGTTLPIRIYPSIFYYNGKVAGIRGIVIDLSAQKKVERELQESEEKFRTLVEQSLDGIIIADFTGKILFANPRVGEILSYNEVSDLVGTSHLFSFVLSECREIFVNGLRRVELGADDFHEIFEVVTRDKRMIWIESTGKKIRYRGVPAVFLSIHEITEQKKTLDALLESEQKMAAIFMHSPIALALVSAVDGVFIDVNEAFISNTGYSRDEVIGSTSETLGLFPDVETYHQIVRVLQDHREVSGMEIPVRSSSGEIRICQFSTSFLLMGGKPIILSSIQDITERKTTQAAFETLVRSMVGTTGMQSFQKIIESISSWLHADIAMVGELQPDQKTVKVLFMLSSGQEIRDLLCPLKGTPYADVVEKGFCIYEDNMADLFPDNPEIQKNKIRGFIGASLKNSQDQIIGILCMFFQDSIKTSPAIRDIIDIVAVKAAAEIERERILQVLKESQSKLAEAMDLAKIVNWEYDVDSGMFSFDDRFYALYGTTAEKEGGTLMPAEIYAGEFVYPGDSHLVAIETKKALETTDPDYVSYVEHRIIRRDGEVRNICVRIRVTKDADGRTIKTHGANQDITDLKRIEEALRQANRQITLLTTITRHDILNQTSVISGFLDIAEVECNDPVLSDYLARIRNANEEIKSHIMFTRIYQNLGSQEPQWIALDTVIPPSPVHSLTIFRDLKNFCIYADPMLGKVFSNLLDNSLRHGERVHEIRVSANESANDLVVVWEDNGVGIPEDEKELIFKRGYGKNTGLGLFLVKDILSLTAITIAETGDGSGARFEIHVPRGSYRREIPHSHEKQG